MKIDTFINQISKKTSSKRVMNIKQMKNFLGRVSFTESLYLMLLRFDALNCKWIKDSYDYNAKSGNPFPKESLFSLKIFIPYISEKIIIQSNQNLKNNKYSERYILNQLYHATTELGNFKITADEEFINKFMFFYAYEQFSVQETPNYQLEVLRLLKLYKDYPEVDEFCLNEIGLTLEELCICTILFFIHFFKYDKVSTYYPLKNFYLFTNNIKGLSKEKVDKFLDFILIEEEEFKNKYNYLRKKSPEKNNEFISYDKLQTIDRFLPKISFHYPFITDKNKKYIFLVSYSSFLESSKLERLYMYLYENTKIKEFRSRIHGPALERYIRDFAKKHTDAINIYGDEVYYPIKEDGKPNKKKKFDAPDVIIEFEKFVIFIECKSKPFNILEALKNYDTYDFSRLTKDINKSLENIDNYLNHKKSFKDKKVYKFIAYFFNHPMLLDSTLYKLKGFDNSSPEEIILTNIHALEEFFNIQSKSLDKVIEDFYTSHKKDRLAFGKYISTNYYNEIKSDIVEQEFKEFLTKYF